MTEAPTPEAQLQAWMARLDAKTQKLALAVRASLRKRIPTANELAYDYTDSVVISYSPTDKGIDGVMALKAGVNGVALYFNPGRSCRTPRGCCGARGSRRASSPWRPRLSGKTPTCRRWLLRRSGGRRRHGRRRVKASSSTCRAPKRSRRAAAAE